MNQIAGRVFCITGKLENFPTKKVAFEEIARRGGCASISLTTECTYLVLGAKGSENYAYGSKGTKQKQAEEWMRRGHPLRIITENQLIAMLEASEEVPDSEQGRLLGRLAPGARQPVERDVIGDLRISESYWQPVSQMRQVLRVTYESGALSDDAAHEARTTFQGLKRLASSLGLKSSVRTELYPAGWALTLDEHGQAFGEPDGVALGVRIVAILDSDEAKAVGRELADRIKTQVVAAQLGGELSLRIWDESYRYGRYWIQKLVGK